MVAPSQARSPPLMTRKVSSLFHSQSLNDISARGTRGLGLEERKHRLADFSQISGLPRRQITTLQQQKTAPSSSN